MLDVCAQPIASSLETTANKIRYLITENCINQVVNKYECGKVLLKWAISRNLSVSKVCDDLKDTFEPKLFLSDWRHD